jgi:DNA-binding NtrC family response regulator
MISKMKEKIKILAVDDDVLFLTSLKKVLELSGYFVETLANPNKTIEAISANNFSTILLDVRMPGKDGVELFKEILKSFPYIPVIMISGQSNISVAVDAIKNGAFDFIEKPLDPDRLLITIKNAITKKELVDEKIALEQIVDEESKFVCKSPLMVELIKQVELVAKTNAKILITGETGTGKEVIARQIHLKSDRKTKPYIRLNCAAIPSELLESELFGHKKGSFTGAIQDRQGKFLAADGGTLFLDEIGDMSYGLQSKLLRVLEESEIEIIGENNPRKIDVRVISATNKDLEELINRNLFRSDLYHRLNVVKINIAPLRQRREDILPLTYYFLEKFNDSYNKNIISLNRQVEAILVSQKWLGNVRELRNILEKLVIYAQNDQITVNDIFNILRPENIDLDAEIEEFDSLKSAKIDFEKKYIIKHLEKNQWNITQTADELGLDRTNLFKKMQNLGIKK